MRAPSSVGFAGFVGFAGSLHPSRPLVPLLALSFALAGCASSEVSHPPAASPVPRSSAQDDAASPPAPVVLPFIEDDYARALAEARTTHKLLFVDAWAPWCHTCLSMKAFTFRDAKVRAHATELVWASIDTEQPVNAAWVASHPMHAWPTFFLVEPEGGKTVLEWPSSATADELVRLIEVARESTRHEGVLAKAEERTLAGNAAAAAGKADDAIAAWRDALAIAPPGWPGRAATLESLLDRLLAKKDYAACADTAERELPNVPHGGARAATLALTCATELPAGEARHAVLDRALERVRQMAADESEAMLPDDRSCLYEGMVDALEADGRPADVKAVAAKWATFLEEQAAAAPDPTARAVFDAHRVDAYLKIGAPERAVPVLEASARDFPTDYNPPARLARAYLAMKRYDDALAAIDRGIALVYGPRALRLYATKADILEAKGNRAAAASVLKDAIDRVGPAVPPRYLPQVEQLKKRERALEASR